MFSIDSSVIPFAVYDVIRLLIIQTVTQLSFTMLHKTPFFSPIFLQTVSFLIIGSLIFWFVFYKPISNTFEKDIKDRKIE